MNIQQKENYTLFTSQSSVLSEVLNTLSEALQKHTRENIVLQISDNLNITVNNFSVFLNIASEKKANKTSFVLIIKSLNIDDLPEEINIVPTLQEAEDILEMENIERELGF